jgi:hypothetical protein
MPSNGMKQLVNIGFHDMIKIWEVLVSEPCWRGGDYNGSWSSQTTTHQFSTLEKALKYKDSVTIKDKYNGKTTVYGPTEIKID